jgi:predicted GIY-YIG superfamily endonuclease
MSSWHVYILRCSDGSLYTGISTDVVERIKKHNAGKGAAYTRSRLPVALVWEKRMASESAARKREAKIKSWSRVEKLELITDASSRSSQTT